MSIASIWAREMIVTFLGTSRMLSSVPNTEVNGRDVGRICCSRGTSFTLYFSIWTAVSVLPGAAWVWAVVGVAVVGVLAGGGGVAVCARLNDAKAARVSPAASPIRLGWII